MEPLRESRHFVGFVPWMVTDVMRSSWPGSPHLVVRQHQEAVSIVAALLLGALLGRRSAPHTMNSASVVHAGRIGVAIAVEVGHEATLVGESLVESARADRHFVGKVSQETIHSKPVVAESSRPIETVSSFPLRSEVPSEWNRFRPENPARFEFNFILNEIFSTYGETVKPLKFSGFTKLM